MRLPFQPTELSLSQPQKVCASAFDGHWRTCVFFFVLIVPRLEPVYGSCRFDQPLMLAWFCLVRVCSIDTSFIVWDVKNHKLARKVSVGSDGQSPVVSCAISADGAYVLTGEGSSIKVGASPFHPSPQNHKSWWMSCAALSLGLGTAGTCSSL